MPYVKWLAGRKLMRRAASQMPDMPPELRRHASFACERLQGMALEISETMSKFQLSLADRQCRMTELSSRCQALITILATSLYAARQPNEVIRTAADMFCQNETRKLTGRRPSNSYYRGVTELGNAIADGRFPGLEQIDAGEILMPYDR